MLSVTPIDLVKIPQAVRDREILRSAMIAELDAVNLYEQLAAMTKDKSLKIVLYVCRQRRKDPRRRIPGTAPEA